MPCLILAGIAFVVVVVIAANTVTRCQICGNVLRRSRYSWTLEGQKKIVCPNCNRRLENQVSKAAFEPPARPRKVPLLPPLPGSAAHLAEVISKLEAAKGPATRRSALAAALEQIRDPAARQSLMLEASRIEVAAVLDKVEGLKTPAAKRRNLEAALVELQNDAVPDELQAQQIQWLKDALADLE